MEGLKKLLKTWARNFLRNRIPSARFLGMIPAGVYGLVLDSLISVRRLGQASSLTIIQVGANDGVTNDPLFPNISDLSDTEAQIYLIEPQPLSKGFRPTI